MKTVLLMRHAKSSWNNSRLADHDRPLNNRGRKDAPRMGRLLKDLDLIPETIISSTAVRAKHTVEGLLETCPFEGEVRYIRDLYHADVEELLEALHNLSSEFSCAMLVGHNPGMEFFLEALCDENEHMPTAAVAHIIFEVEGWTEIDIDSFGVLEKLYRPKELS